MIFSGEDIEKALPDFLPNTSVLRLLWSAIQKHGDKIYQIESQTDKTETFTSFGRNSSSIAAELNSRGISSGDLVLLCCNKSSAAFAILLGTMLAGATAMVANPQVANEINNYTAGRPVKFVFCDSLYRESLQKSITNLIPSPPLMTTEDAIASVMSLNTEFTLFEVRDVKSHIPLVLFTSGSTGDPKGVLMSDFTLQRLGYTFEDESINSVLLISSFTWLSNPLFLIASILKGYSIVLSNSKEPREHYQLIQKYKIDMWLLCGSNLSHYIKEEQFSQVDLSSLKEVIIGGDVLTQNVTETFTTKVLQSRFKPKNVYGMTEVGVVTNWRGQDPLDFSRAHSCGRLSPGVQMKVTDKDGNIMDAGKRGFLWVKSLSQSRYLGQSALDIQQLDKDGFFRTGDVAYISNDGFVYVTGRSRDMDDLNNSQMVFSKIEDIVNRHPLVLESACVYKPNSNELAVFIVKTRDSTLPEIEIVTLVQEKEKEIDLNGNIYFIDILPRNANCKLRRHVLEEMLPNMTYDRS